MAKKATSDRSRSRITRPGSDELELAQAEQVGSDFTWHFGRVTNLGFVEITKSKTVTILWEEGGISSQQGDISDAQWEIFRLAFVGSGRVAILSDQDEKYWMYDYRFLEAVRS
jgi:hypothetical protein